ncbi:MAG: nuclear transport factor 2 family protein [Proteobacteria bacterium]|nr:nuclear transport factor 2 family protein [Pseudomonadota bacterium]MDA0994887.1 nuclear transport factor 2 family protein [Pseudomonadota bacterium]
MITEFLFAMAALAQLPGHVRLEVICAETGFSRAAEARDKSSFLSFVDPDARFITDRIARGRDEIAEAWSFAFSEDGPTIRWRPAVVEVASDGNVAISRGPYRLTRIDENGDEQQSWGHFISTWRRNNNGQWQVLFDTGGDNAMVPSEQDISVLESEPVCP